MVLRPTEEELYRRRIVGIGSETVANVSSTDFPGHYPGEDHSWDIEKFKKGLHVEFHEFPNPSTCSFSLVGVDASIANAFRRILLAEVATVAIEHVFVNQNTSIVQDEVLAQRLGLIPLKGDKEAMRWLRWMSKRPDDPNSKASDYNTLVLHLKVTCTRNPDAKKGEKDPTKLYHNAHVYASALEFVPRGRQDERFPSGVQPVNPDILLAKMRPGQELDIEMHCVKGVGSDHAKFSPVATASYRLLPTIDIVRPILGKDAEKFARCFPKGVIGLETVTAEEAAREGSGYEGQEGQKKAVVKNAFKDTVSRECLRHEEFQGKVKLGRVRDHFIFSIESTGQFDSDELFVESIMHLKTKCQRAKTALSEMMF
ncbi:MAG: DNA-directed RNA polymerase core subunit rpc40 [Watsoniomyces obsoletus]|nr:MAG: DNA-directed RNA polymerase core subunit rpc40 [Watsoniomyces obsoletus]